MAVIDLTSDFIPHTDSRCDFGFYRDALSDDCLDCDDGGVEDTLNALITFLIFFNIIVYGYGPLKRLIKRQKEGIIALKNSSTLLFVTYQIIVELSAVHQFAGGYGYPGNAERTKATKHNLSSSPNFDPRPILTSSAVPPVHRRRQTHMLARHIRGASP